MEKQLKDKVAIVTGASRGLGETIVRRLVREDCKVAASDISSESLNKVADDVNKDDNTKVLGIQVDVTKEEEVVNMVNRTVEEFGRVDILVSNAGILIAKEITEFPADEWRKVIEVNLVGYFLCAKTVSKIMKEQKSGVIIQINSKSGKKGSFRNSAYAASKFGGIGLTQSLALELAPYNIRVNAICPGNLFDSPLWVESLFEQYAKNLRMTKEDVRKKYLDQIPLGRGCTYDDVCNLLIFLASENSSYMTGQAINITGGQEMR